MTVRSLLTRSPIMLLGCLLAVGNAQQRPAITGIAFARMYSANEPVSDSFYKMLGFAPEPEIHDPEPGIPTLQRYDVTASQWLEVVPLPVPAPHSRLAAVGFTTRNATGLEKYLVSRGVAIVQPLKHGQFSVLDPEGNRIVFVQSGSHAMLAKRADGIGESTSQRIIHAGFEVKSAAAEDHFYREILGFHEYWHGGMTDDKLDFVSLQVPDGTDWLEYMLNGKTFPDPVQNLRQIGVMDHFSLGVVQMKDAVSTLARNGCASTREAANCKRTQMGRDGKVQLNVIDPDFTRVEYMEFKPSGTICCSAFQGRQPTEVEEK